MASFITSCFIKPKELKSRQDKQHYCNESIQNITSIENNVQWRDQKQQM